MNIYIYCQHVLGVGHLFRTLEICHALAPHAVTLISGGSPVAVPLPGHVTSVNLPGLMMDRDFTSLFAVEKGRPVSVVKDDRRRRLWNLFENRPPDLFMVELYPFGRKAFRFELDPVLQALRSGRLPACPVVCSLRDILVEKQDSKTYEARVLSHLNSFFDAVLVHADPKLVRLSETFSRMDEIVPPVVYTGFVAPKPAADARPKIRKSLGLGDDDLLVVASVGGGSVGASLLEAVVSAWPLVETLPAASLYIYTGPHMDPKTVAQLKKEAGSGTTIQRFTNDFVSWLAAADLSVSMAGYNTSMNILAARTPALVWPFGQNREQRLRAERLARLGALAVLQPADLHPPRLARIMDAALARKTRPANTIDLNGADHTAQWIHQWMERDRRFG